MDLATRCHRLLILAEILGRCRDRHNTAGGVAPWTATRRRPRPARPELPPQRDPRRRARRRGRDGRDPQPALARLGRRRGAAARRARRRRPSSSTSAGRSSRRRSSSSATSAIPDEAAALVLGSIGFLPGEIETAADVGSLTRARVFAGYAGWGADAARGRDRGGVVDPRAGAPRGRLHRGADRPVERGAAPQGRRVRGARADAARSEPQLGRLVVSER